MFNGSFFGGSDDFVFTSLYDGGSSTAFQNPVITPDGTGVVTGSDGSGLGAFRRFAADGSSSVWTIPYNAGNESFDIDSEGTRVVHGSMTPGIIGSVRIYTVPTTPGAVVLEQTLQAPIPAVGDLYGQSVAINYAGSLLWVAAKDVIYMYTRSGTAWTYITSISLPVDSSDTKTINISVSSDVNTLVVGRPGYPVGGIAGRGIVYVYNGNSLQATINPSDNTAYAALGFGGTVSITQDGNKITATSSPIASTTVGDVYTYTRSGSTWTTGVKTSLAEGRVVGAAVSPNGLGMIALNYSTTTPIVAIFTWTGSTWSRITTVDRATLSAGQGLNRGQSLANDYTFIVGPRIQMFRKTIV